MGNSPTAGVVLGYVEPVLADELGQFQRPMFLEAARLPRELLDYSNGLQTVSNANRDLFTQHEKRTNGAFSNGWKAIKRVDNYHGKF